MTRATPEQRAWYFYDWANSAFITTVATVLYAPYLVSVAERAACGYAGTVARPCQDRLTVLGIAVSPGSLVFYVITLSTVISAFVLPVIGAIADRVSSRRRLMGGLAWSGAATTALMFGVTGTNWEFGCVLLIIANLLYAASIVVYDALLIDVAGPDERDRISSHGWALGYAGGGLLLAANLIVVTTTPFGLTPTLAVRVSLLSAALWWACFTVIPYRGIRDRPPRATTAGTLMQRSFGQLVRTLREMRQYPQTLLLLVSYMIYNDGIQTVIYSASVFGQKQLGFGPSATISVILVVQFVGFSGALAFGIVAARFGSYRTIGVGLAVWVIVVVSAFKLPVGNLSAFLAVAVVIGLVLGGTQALSRSFFSQFIPPGREAEYFSLYQACERGTSWLGTLAFGLVHQVTGSYRPALLALVLFFVVGGLLLWRLEPRRGIVEAGNPIPRVV